MAHLALALLGPFQATLDEQPLAALTAVRLRALLAYLAVEAGREHSRVALAGLFWPERPDRDALSALRYALSHLRQAIADPHAQPPYLLITRHTVQFNRAGDYRLDVDAFSLAGREADTIAELTAAIALYRGEFLAGLALGDSPAFEEWLLLKREQFHRQALTLLQQLAAHHEQRGDYAPATACARQVLTLEPWDEAAHRRLMRLLALSGQRSAALAQYESCCQMLAAELRVAPEDETTRLYQGIRAGTLTRRQPVETIPAAVQPAPSAAHAPSPAALFVGREGELARLEQWLGRALAGRGRVVFVSGEAGSGKTALLTEFARRALAAHPDLLFVAGRGAAQAGTGDPYLPFREILGRLSGEVEAGWAWGIDRAGQSQRLSAALPVVVETLVEAGSGLLDTLIPGESLARRVELLATGDGDWRRRLEALLAARRGQPPPPDRRERLFEQVSRFLQAVARRQPLLLALDDLQWADPVSISLLFHLGRHLGGSRILVACAYRPADLALRDGQRHPLQPVVHEFQREWGEIVVDLDQAEGRAFVNAYLDSEPNRLDDEFRARLYHTAGGNPLFTTELVQSLQERGCLTRDTAGRWVAGAALDWQKMPARVEAVIAERLGRLPAEWRAMLDVASVTGEEFAAELVAGVLGVDERAVRGALGGPLNKQQRLVQPAGLGQTATGQRLSRYRFRHGLFQRYLYQELDEAERASLHEAVGNQLAALHSEQAQELAPWLAWHFEAAGALDKAVDYCLAAGHHAYRLSAHEEAIDHYRRGLALLHRLPHPTDPERRQASLRRELALQLGLDRPLEITRGWGNAEQTSSSKRAYELAHELASRGEMAAEFLQAFFNQIETAAARGEFQQALALSEHFLTLARQQGSPLALGLAHWALGASHLFRGEYVAGREHLEAALDIYRNQPAQFADLTPIDMGVNCLAWLSFALCALGYPEQGLAREAITLARSLELPLSQGAALTVAGCSIHMVCRQPPAVQAYAAELYVLAQAKKLLLLREWVEIALGWSQVEAGDFEPGIARMKRGVRAWQQMGTVVGHFLHLSLLAKAYGQAGQVEQGLACIEEGLALMHRVGYSQAEPELHRVRGELLRLSNNGEAEQCFWRAIEVARRQETRWWELRATVSLARLWQGRGDERRRQARELLAGLVAWFGEGFDLPDLREAQTLIRELAAETEQN